MKKLGVIILIVFAVALVAFFWNKSKSPEVTGDVKPLEYVSKKEFDQEVARLEQKREAEGRLDWREAFQLGVVYLHNGELKKSIEILEEARRYKMNSHNLLESLGMAYHRDGRTGKALELGDMALKLRPDNEHLKGIVSAVTMKEALKYRKESLEYKIENEPVISNAIKFELASIYMGLNETDNAEKILIELVSKEDATHSAFDMLAHLKAMKGEFDEAIKLEEQAIALSPETEDYKLRLNEMKKLSAVKEKNDYHND